MRASPPVAAHITRRTAGCPKPFDHSGPSLARASDGGPLHQIKRYSKSDIAVEPHGLARSQGTLNCVIPERTDRKISEPSASGISTGLPGQVKRSPIIRTVHPPHRERPGRI